jgi:hypothetical protein
MFPVINKTVNPKLAIISKKQEKQVIGSGKAGIDIQ